MLLPRGRALRTIASMILAALVVVTPWERARATKPCMPPPCTPDGQFDALKCRALADWIAVGSIGQVVHHPTEAPLLKDFVEFTFTPQRWERDGGKKPATIHFQVSWFDNMAGPPEDVSGQFRIYGIAFPSDPSWPNQYLHIEPLKH